MLGVTDVRPIDVLTLQGLQHLAQSRSASAARSAAELLSQAAARGDPRASARLAAMAAAGIGVPQDWACALDHLLQAAQGGWPPAQAELRLLAEPDRLLAVEDAHDGEPWQALRQQVDLSRWLTLPPKEVLSETPRLRRFAGFVSPAVCRWLIDRAREGLGRARTYDAHTGEARLDESRSNEERDFSFADADLVLTLVRARMALASGLPPSVMESTKVLHYAVGQQFKPHCVS